MDIPETDNSRSLIPAGCTDILLCANPKAGARSGRPLVDRLVHCLRERGLATQIVTDIDDLQRLSAAKMADGTLRAVVAAGGDGTVGLVANRTPAGTPIAVLPLGTENLLAKYLGLEADPEGLAAILEKGRLMRLDAGEANGRLFLLMAGCGFDAEVVRRMHQQRTGHISHLSYFKPILDSIRTYEYPELRIRLLDTDGPTNDQGVLRAKWVFVVNLPRYAAGLSLVPQADGTDGRLDVCTFREGSLLSGLMYLAGVVAGQHQNWEDCTTAQVRRLRIEADEPVPFQLDGDPGGYLPVDVRVLPGRLTLVVGMAETMPAGKMAGAARL
ncbi:MAG: diacylglycerol kinase family lipid kinase [Pirellulaceae bacterium]|nr:diacylglycerol kinase family lipid kinase [Pirellulaceae bacterium]